MENWSLSWVEALSGGLSGPTRLRVHGRSMLPTLRPGDEVLVEPATAEALVPGDFVVVAGAPGGFLHRFLGRRGDQVLTKGDGRLSLDPAWPPQAVLGRMTDAWRAERCIYRRTGGRLRRERWLALGHRALGDTWGFLRRVKALLVSMLLVAFMAAGVYAAVTISDFHTELDGEIILVCWTTGSETGNMGFHVWRGTDPDSEFKELPEYISSDDVGAGATYTYPDSDIEPGVIYYYRVQDVPSGGVPGEFYVETVTGTLPLATEEPTDETTPTPTPTPTPTKTPTPTPTPHPNVSFWVGKDKLKSGECTSVFWSTNHVSAVYLDGNPKVGEGSESACAAGVYELYVIFPDNSAETFTVTITTDDESSATATLTPEATATEDPDEETEDPDEATATSEPTAAPTATPSPDSPVRFSGTGTPPPTATHTPDDPHRTPAATPDNTSPGDTSPGDTSPVVTPQFQAPAAGVATATRIAVLDETASGKAGASSDWPFALLVFGVSVGIGLIAVGLWLWSRQQ